jgi:putative endonuclease
MKQYFVYILKCSDKSYYTGVTNNIEKRFYEHQTGLIENCYTHTRRPLELVLVEEFNDINDAIAREKQIKGWTRRKKEALIAGNFEKLAEYSKPSLR